MSMAATSHLDERRASDRWALAAVVALHGGALLALAGSPPAPPLAMAPVLAVSLIQMERAAPAVPVTTPAAAAPRQLHPALPLLAAVADESAVAETVAPQPPAAVETPAQVESPAETAAPTAPAASAATPPEPVQSPRFDADYLDNPAPPYPALSRRLREEGTVLLHVLVDGGGAPARVELKQSSGHARLDQAALDTVQRWRFTPARQGSAAVAGWVIVPVSFTLRS